MVSSKPYIHLVETINGKYVYEVNTNEIIAINDIQYELLQNILNRKGFVDYSKEERECLDYLLKQGYLSNNRVKIIEHPMTDILPELLKRRVSSLTIQITQQCNLRCSYCIYSDLNNQKQRSHSSKTMHIDMLKKAIDFLAEHSIDSDNINIGFYGGEPLVAFGLVKKAVDYAKEVFLGKNLSFNMTTNGTIFTEEIINFLVDNDFALLVSLDGPEDIHDRNRRYAINGRGSFQDIIANLDSIKKYQPEFYKTVHINMVVDPQNEYDAIGDVFKDLDEDYKANFMTNFMDDGYSLEKTVFSDEYIARYRMHNAQSILSNLLDIKIEDTLVSKDFIKELEQSFKDSHMVSPEFMEKAAPAGMCYPGYTKLFVNVTGDLYPCERVSENSSVMKIGNVFEGFDFSKAKQLLNLGKITEEDCKNCWAFRQCNMCAQRADNGANLSGDRKRADCDYAKSIAERRLQYYILKNEVANHYTREAK